MPSSSSSSNSNTTPFRSYPQKFPKTRSKAAQALSAIHTIIKKGPRTMVATVTDTAFHTAQGYVTCTTQLGVVQVYGIPYGTVVPQMRVLVRQMGGAATNRAYIFDGYAPNLSALGSLSGSVAYTSAGLAPTVAPITSLTSGVPAQSGLIGPSGYYWHCFFYLPQLTTTPVTIWQMKASSGGTTLALEARPDGLLQLRDGTNHGYITNGPIPPHVLHWVQIQPGNTGNEFLVDTLSDYTGLIGGSDEPVFTGNTTAYQLSLLSNSDGSQLCPLGSFVSKWGYGTSWSGSAVLPLANVLPEQDGDLPTHTTSGTPEPYYLLLCGSDAGSSTLTNTASFGSGTNVSVNLTYANVLSTGPY